MSVMFMMATMVLYLTGTALFLGSLLRRSEAWSQVSLGVTAVGFVSHTIALAMRMMVAGHVPLTSFYEALSFFSWSLVVVFLWVEFRHRLHVLGAFILPIASLSLLSAAALPQENPALAPMLQTVWVHVTLSMLGAVGFAVAFVAGIMYLIQDGLLKSKRFNILYAKLPSLDFLDHLNQQSIVMGFPLLTLGIITGAISARNGNITKAEVTVTDDRRGINNFVIEVADLRQLQDIIAGIRDVKDVINVERVRGL